MLDGEKTIKGLEETEIMLKQTVNRGGEIAVIGVFKCCNRVSDALVLLKEQEKEIKALRLLVEWATDCDFGFDQFPDEYERYKDEIEGMKYIDGMIHVAKRTLEDHGAFEGG